MKFDELTSFFQLLEASDCRYLIVGGLAVVAHGHIRVTHDLDLVLAMDDKNLNEWIQFLKQECFTPSIPIQLEDIQNSEKRLDWKINKNLEVISLSSDRYPTLVLDLFAECPFDFEAEFSKAIWIDFPIKNLKLPFVRKSILLEMKKLAGRALDLDDIDQLKAIDDNETQN